MGSFSIHPKIGVARLGNSQTDFYLGPEKTGGLPIACDPNGNTTLVDGKEAPVRVFKDAIGAIKRQAARFKIFEHLDDGTSREVTLADPRIEKIEWTAHIANKKPIWYGFSELQGDLEFGEGNSYENQQIPLRNPSVTDPTQRRALMIDPGPQTVCTPGESRHFNNFPPRTDYPSFSFPAASLGLNPPIQTLGEIRMDADGRLILLGGMGVSTGTTTLTTFAGGDNWWDDISDGYVTATVYLKSGEQLDLYPAWVIVGSPKYAPELVNIVTLDDTTYDIAVRFLGYDGDLYDQQKWPAPEKGYDPIAGFNPDFRPSYQRDLEPIFRRPEDYRWVAPSPVMADFTHPRFDLRDPSPENAANRQRYFEAFRVPVPPEANRYINQVKNGPNTLFGENQLPLMPLNSGDNSVSNTLIYKFLTLTPTQYFFLHQWAAGKFDLGEAPPHLGGDVLDLDRQVLGNLVGAPFCPGIETTWIVRAKQLYKSPFTYDVAHWTGGVASLVEYYRRNGLSLTSDPQTGDACEPGDLTKRMAIPWQSDFFQCTVEQVNINSQGTNQIIQTNAETILVPPTYYVYWWPPQSPMFVIAGDLDPGNQIIDGYVSNQPAQVAAPNGLNVDFQTSSGIVLTAAGQPVTYARGVNSFNQMTIAWADLGFIVNVGTEEYRNFVEKERNAVYLAQWAAAGLA